MPTPPATTPLRMLDVIREHNRLNGLGFVLAECVLVGAVGLGIALGGGWGLVIGGGIALNMATVALIAIQQLRHGERLGGGPWRLLDRRYRAQVAREHPDLNRHTTLLTGAMLVPFLLLVLVLAQRGAGQV